MRPDGSFQHFVEIDHEKCIGCVLCMKECPMKAIRVLEDGKAHILGQCINCENCINVCPKGAIESQTSKKLGTIKGKYKIVTISPVLFTQFGEDVMPNEVMIALKNSFDYVYDQAYLHELFNIATQIYINENRSNPDVKFPLISPMCPVVIRLILYRFPKLLLHVLPFMRPREIAARELRKKAVRETNLDPEEIGVYHITPCSAKLLSVQSSIMLKGTTLDGVVGINEVYMDVKKGLTNIFEVDEAIYHYSSGVGIAWSKSGGEIGGLEGVKALAVSGIKETISYLQKIELGLLKGIEYVEFRACNEGCIGGHLVAIDKYEAKRTTDRLVKMFGSEKRVKYDYVRRLYDQGFFFTNKDVRTYISKGVSDLETNINRAKEVHRLWERLPQKDCGACGSPDCKSFAEDVVDGLFKLDQCLFLGRRYARKKA